MGPGVAGDRPICLRLASGGGGTSRWQGSLWGQLQSPTQQLGVPLKTHVVLRPQGCYEQSEAKRWMKNPKEIVSLQSGIFFLDSH